MCVCVLCSYPDKIAQFTHRTHCYIPAPLAHVLDTAPELVAPIVQAFYYRDPIDLKVRVYVRFISAI